MSRPGGYLYAIMAEGQPYIKIGCTAGSPQKRVQLLQTGQPYVLRLCASVPLAQDLRSIEKCVHAFLEEKRQHGEWFAIDPLDNITLQALIVEAIAYRDAHKPLPKTPAIGNDVTTHVGSWLSQEFGRRIRRRRMALGMIQRELAEKIAIPQGHVSRWEKGECVSINLDKLALLAQALYTTSDFLLALHDEAA